MKRRGFSLLEILLTLTVVGVLAGLGLVASRKGPAQGTLQLAAKMASELRAARALAISSREPVALSLPSAGGTTALSTGCTLWRGESRPRSFKVINFASEVPRGQIFCGTWPTSAPVTIDRPTLGAGDTLSITQWFGPQPLGRDPLFVFTPSGSVVTNDLPLLDGAYRLIACLGAVYVNTSHSGTATVSPQPAYFQLQQAEKPCTISLEPTGSVRVEEGIPSSSSTLAAKDCNSASPLAAAFGALFPTNQTPSITRVKLSPPIPSGLPAGVDSRVTPGGHVVLEVEANDPDGDRLYCTWTSDGGGFTHSGESKMEYDLTSGRWKSRWVFRPDPDDAPPRIYNLSCQVRDERGNPGIGAAGVELTPSLQLVPQRRIVFSRLPYEEAYSVNADGTDLKAISVMKAIGGPADWVSLSPDKSKLLLLNQQTLDLWCCNIDGTGVRQLTAGLGCYGAAWSPDGSKIAYVQASGGPYPRMFLMPASGLVTPPTSPSPLIPPLQISTGVEFGWSQPCFNHDGTRLVCLGFLPGTNQGGIYVIRDPLTAPSGTFITPTETSDGNTGFGIDISYCLHPTERDRMAFSRKTGGGNSMFQMIKDDGSGLVNLPTPLGEVFVDEIEWSDDGTEVIYCSNATWLVNYTPGSHTLSNPRQVAPFGGSIDW